MTSSLENIEMHEPRLRSRGTFQPDLTLDSKSEAYNHLQSPPETPVREGIAELNQSIMLPPVDQGFGAWSFVVSAFFVEVLLWGFPMSYGTFLEAYMSDEVYSSQPHADVLLPLIGQLSTGLMFCSGPLIYPLTDRYPEYRRPSIWLGGILAGSSLLAASFVTNVVLLVLLQGAMYGIGGALMYAPCITFLHEWFITRRGFANGIMFCGTATGGVFFPLVLPHIITAVGVTKTIRYMSIFVFTLMIPILPFYKGRVPQTRAYIQGPAPRGAREQFSPLWNPTFVGLLLVNTVQSFAHFLPLVWLPTFATDMNISSTNANLALALVNGTTILSQIVLGYLADRYNPWLLSASTCFLASVTTFVFWGVLSYKIAGLLAFGAIYGLVIGGWASLFSSFIKGVVSDDSTMATSMFGYLLFTRGVGNVLSTPIASALRAGHNAAATISLSSSGFQVGDGKYMNMIIYVGSSFAGASCIAALGWGREMLLLKRSRVNVPVQLL